MKRNQKLESLRGLAGFYVMFAHGVYEKYFVLSIFGQETVMMFFILSGFVITYSTSRDRDSFCFRNFFIKRFRRIYPMFVIAMGLAWLTSVYASRHLIPVSLSQVAGNLLMLQDFKPAKPGALFDAFMNPPLWSLSYEWWFYMSFYPIYRFVRAPLQKYVVFGLSSVSTLLYTVFPNPAFLYFAYFTIWWMGVELAREYMATGSVSWKGQRVMLALTLCVVAMWAGHVAVARLGGHPGTLGVYPLLQFRHYVAALAIVGLGLVWSSVGFLGFNRFVGGFTIFAPVSYGIYIYHWPILRNAYLFEGLPFIVRLGLLCALTLGFSWIVEVRLQPLFVRLSRPFLRRAPEPHALSKAA